MSSAAKLVGQPWTPAMVDRLEAQTGERFELIGGVAYMMAGGTVEHSEVAARLIGQLAVALDGSDCRPLTSDLRIQVGTDEFRYPDASVLCGRVDPRATAITEPTAIFEITSPGTRGIDLSSKRDEYLRLPSLRAYVVIDLQDRCVVIHSQDEDGPPQARAPEQFDVIHTPWIFFAHVVTGGRFALPGTSAILDADALLAEPLGAG